MAVNNYERDHGADVLPEEVRDGKLFALCPCGEWSRAYLINDVRAHEDVDIAAQKWACQGCRGAWIRDGRTSKQAIAAAGGQTAELVDSINDKRIRRALMRRGQAPAWIPAADVLAFAEERRLGELKAMRDRNENGGASTPFGTVDTDPVSVRRINGAVQMAGIVPPEAFSISWTMADNSVVSVNAAQMTQVGLAVGQHVDACHQHYRTLRDLLEAATDLAEVEAVDIQSGWPS